MKTHKLLWSFVSIMILSFVICACANNTEAQIKKELLDRIDSNAAVYPVYYALSEEEKELYLNICAAIESHKTSVYIGEYDSKAGLQGNKIQLFCLQKSEFCPI